MKAPLPSGADKVAAVRKMFDDIAPRYELVNRVMTFGLDTLWRQRALRHLALPPRSSVLDIACGTGDFCRLLEKAGHRSVGVDLSYGMLKAARTKSPLLQADSLTLPFADGAFDGATCGFALRNFVELPSFFAELARVVRSGGRVALLDAYRPSNPVLAAGHHIHFDLLVPKIGSVLSNGDAYSYLPRSLSYLPSLDQMKAELEGAGFRKVNRTTMLGGAAHLFTATRV